jgi:pyruvate formate lyase activating enzyme
VVISGGEPLLQDDLIDFIGKVKKQGFLVKVDTNGAFPEKLGELFEKHLVDYVAMDVKAPKRKYCQLTGIDVDTATIESSMNLIKDKAPAYEFKTTFVPDFLKKEDIVEIAEWLTGAEKYYLQQFKVVKPLLSKNLETVAPYSRDYLIDTLKTIQPFFKRCALRGV